MKEDYLPLDETDGSSVGSSRMRASIEKLKLQRDFLFSTCIFIIAVMASAFYSGYLIIPQMELTPRDIFPSARNAVRWVPERLSRDLVDNKYANDPRPEFDDAWHDLLEPMVIKISQNEMDALDDESIAFSDGSGYMAEMAVYHELHCVKKIRQHLALDHYYPNLTDYERMRESAHINHCLEYWRVAAKCRGDTSLATFFWDLDDAKPKVNFYSNHVCVDWERLDSFARSRMVYIGDYSQLDGAP